MKCPNGRTGYLLVEMIVFMTIVGIASSIAILLLRTNFRIWRQIDHHDAITAIFDSAAAQLRRDVWGAQSIRPDGRTLSITGPDGQTIEWDAETAKGIVRAERRGSQSAERRWDDMDRSVRFEAVESGLTLIVEGEGGGALHLPSELMLLKGARR